MKKRKKDLLDSKKMIDKIFLWIKRVFTDDAYYYNNLNTRATFPKFVLKRWFTICSILILPIIMLYIAATVDESVHAFGYQSISTSIMYFGTVSVGIVVYYFTWMQALRDNNSLRIRVSVESMPNYDNGDFIFYSKSQAQNSIANKSSRYTSDECNYIKIEIANRSSRSPLYIKHINNYYAFRKKGNVVTDAGKAYISDMNENEFLEYGESRRYMVGMPSSFFNKDLLTMDVNCWYYLVFKLVNLDGHEAYLVCIDFVSEGCSNLSYFLMNSKKYNKLIKKYGLDILNKIGWGNQVNQYK